MVNRIKTLPPQFQKILKTTSSLADSAAIKIYLVGGIVRDLILKRAVFDLDIVVEGDAIELAHRLSEKIKGRFSKHHAFGTAVVYFGEHKIDIATARTESYSCNGALPKVTPASLKEDLIRRDFTINAMAISLNKDSYGYLIDLYGGLEDLKNKSLKIMHDKSFLDDPTRILRAIRFEQRFGFNIEQDTYRLMKEAINTKALQLVNPHRLRDEIILILQEQKPYLCLVRINSLEGFNFIDKNIRLDKNSFRLFLDIGKAIGHYKKKYKNHRKLKAWVIYLAAILLKLPSEKIKRILNNFAFKRGERIIITSIKSGLYPLKKLNKKLKMSVIYKTLNPYSFESILFFYAYYHRQKQLRKNLDCFLDQLIHIRLKLKGRDLKKMNFKPLNSYGKVLTKLFYYKIDEGFKSKRDEIRTLKRLFRKAISSSDKSN
jgi:tRNA nucleotidyltransferase (CCA-adding enzyme)